MINKGKYFTTEGITLLLENILPFLQNNVPDNGILPKHDPFKDREGIPNHEEKDTDIFREKKDKDLVNKL